MPLFEPASLPDWAEATLIAEIRRVAALVPDGVLSRRRFREHARVSDRTVRRRFGSWEQALTRAGHGHRYGGGSAARLKSVGAVRALSDEALLETVREVARKLGRDTLGWHDVNAHGRVGAQALRRRFGAWDQVMRRAGLRAAPTSRRYSDAELFANLRAAWTRLGRQPTCYEIADAPARINMNTYRYRFGSWKKAIAAFCAAEKARAAAAPADASPRDGAPDPDDEQPTIPAAAPGRPPERPTLSPRLRYAVLARDRFRCRACGRSPATDSGCVLQVDHIVPVSRGGATAPDNLRALCAECNLGRGDRGDESAEPAARADGATALPASGESPPAAPLTEI
jgi:hypothetical protein